MRIRLRYLYQWSEHYRKSQQNKDLKDVFFTPWFLLLLIETLFIPMNYVLMKLTGWRL